MIKQMDTHTKAVQHDHQKRKGDGETASHKAFWRSHVSRFHGFIELFAHGS